MARSASWKFLPVFPHSTWNIHNPFGLVPVPSQYLKLFRLHPSDVSLTVLEMFPHGSTPTEFRVSMYFLQYSRRDSAAPRPSPSRLPVSPPCSAALEFRPLVPQILQCRLLPRTASYTAVWRFSVVPYTPSLPPP